MPKATGSRRKSEWNDARIGCRFWVVGNNPRSIAQSLRRWANKKGYWYDYLVIDNMTLAVVIYGPDKPDNPINLREVG